MSTPTAQWQVNQWYRDSCSCLQTTIASIASTTGTEPLDVLARSVNFYPELGVRHCEYYHPHHPSDGLLGWVCPDSAVTGEWQVCTGLDQLATMLQHGPVIVPVDNYHLPFRPAYHDVHAAHLILVTGHRQHDGACQFHVSDAQPPAFYGWLDADDLVRAWSSENPEDEQDAFFSGASGAERVLSVTVPATGTSSLADRLEQARAGAYRLLADSGPGSVRAARDLLERLDDAHLPDLYVVGWWHQAQAHLHGERWSGSTEAMDGVHSAISLAAHRVSTAWTPVRITAARSIRVSTALRAHISDLVHSYEQYAYTVLLTQERA